jgi:LmbE family N-acetylglucosaminyl deacetylase
MKPCYTRTAWCASSLVKDHTHMAHLMVILAHPDDAEIWAGGTICRHRQRGDRVTVCSLTYNVHSLRGREGFEGAQRLGVDFTCLGLADMAVNRYRPDDVERLSALLLEYKPEIVLTHWIEDTHPDHAASARLVTEALLHYAVAYGLDDVDASRVAFPSVWSCDTYGGLGKRGGFEPEWYVDISAVWPQKIHAIEAHQSQNPTYWIDLIQRQNAFYGYRCNRDYVEGFCRLPLAMVNTLSVHDYLP